LFLCLFFTRLPFFSLYLFLSLSANVYFSPQFTHTAYMNINETFRQFVSLSPTYPIPFAPPLSALMISLAEFLGWVTWSVFKFQTLSSLPHPTLPKLCHRNFFPFRLPTPPVQRQQCTLEELTTLSLSPPHWIPRF